MRVECTVKRERNLLNWFGHVESMREERLIKRVYRESVKGTSRSEKANKMEG